MRRRLGHAWSGAATGLMALLALAGCASGPDVGESPPVATAVEMVPRNGIGPWRPSEAFGASVEGRPLPLITIGDGPVTVLLLATIHGDEAAGTPLLERLADELAADPPDGVRVVMAPDLNPDGRVLGNRGNAHGVDLNRDFLAANRRGGTGATDQEPESAAVADLVRATAPALIVSIHQPVACVDWDGPPHTAVAADAIAAATGLPVRRLGARPGSLGSWAGVDLGIPVITLELPRSAGRDPALDWARYAPGLRAAIEVVTAPQFVGR